jgi:peptidoglycan/LPS O-acetylase OafA/YrhL
MTSEVPPPATGTDTAPDDTRPDPDGHHGLPPTELPGTALPAGLEGLTDRFPAADGCRALAAFGVLLTHVGLLSGFTFQQPQFGAYFARTDVGVSIFFVLSGFLLYRPFAVRRFAGHPRGELGNYARRRLLRIFPAYWVALTIVAFVLRAPPFEEPHSIVAHYLLLQIYDPNQVVAGPIDQAWSLATEVSFYAFLPLWAWLLARRTREPRQQLRVEAWTLAALWAGCISLNLAVIAMGVSGPRFGQLGTWLPFRIHEFVLGMALAVASAWMRHRRTELPRAWSGTQLTLVCWGAATVLFWLMSSRMGFPLTLDFSPERALALRVLYSAVGALVVAPVVLGRQDRGVALRLLANPVAVWLGLISYGIYIWHKAIQNTYLEWTGQEPLDADFVEMLVVTVVFSVLAAAASWYLVERPLMRRRDRRPAAVATS